MSLLQALVLGITQGLTEFIPVSSSGHLIAISYLFKFLGWKEQPLVFDTTLHLSTALALIICFWSDIVSIVRGFVKDLFSKHFLSFNKYSTNGILGLKIIVGSIPVGLIGFLFGDFIEGYRGVIGVSFFLIFGGILMYVAEKSLKKRLLVKDEISITKSFKVGLFQVLSLLPGVSRSGSTISGGMIFGLSRKEATRFSFLLSIPTVLAAGVFKILSSIEYFNMADALPMFVGFLSSFLVGMFAIKFMIKFVKKNKLYPFIYYRLGLALLLLLTLIF